MSALNPAFQQAATHQPWHQHVTPGYDPLLSDVPVQFQNEVPQGLQLNTFTRHPLFGCGHETPADQHAAPTYALSWIGPAQSPYQNLQFCPTIEHRSSGSEHETSVVQQNMQAFSTSQSAMRQYQDHVPASDQSFVCQHNVLTFSPSQSTTPTELQYQDHHPEELTDHPLPSPLPDGRHETPAYEHSLPGFATIQHATPMESQYPDYQVNTFTKHPSMPLFDSEYETSTEQHDSGISYALRSVTPALSQEQVDDTQPSDPTPPISLDSEYKEECPNCQKKFKRAQERDRHVESYLSHSIYCPFQDCPWTGRRKWDWKKHWEKKHSETGPFPGKENNGIYDTEEFVKSILGGTPPDEVAWFAFLKATERLRELGKECVGANVLGRKLGTPPPFNCPSLLGQCLDLSQT